MVRRASKTCYFLNRRARYLALIRGGVRLPSSVGVWIPIANADRSRWETAELLDASYPQLDAKRLSFIALFNDSQVAEFEISDTGVGIALKDQEAVFEEFRQVGTAAEKVEGTGLGLALSRKFIELHGGRLWVESVVGAGSTFRFTLPVEQDG